MYLMYLYDTCHINLFVNVCDYLVTLTPIEANSSMQGVYPALVIKLNIFIFRAGRYQNSDKIIQKPFVTCTADSQDLCMYP